MFTNKRSQLIISLPQIKQALYFEKTSLSTCYYLKAYSYFLIIIKDDEYHGSMQRWHLDSCSNRFKLKMLNQGVSIINHASDCILDYTMEATTKVDSFFSSSPMPTRIILVGSWRVTHLLQADYCLQLARL